MRAAYYEGNRTITIGEGRPVAPAPGQVQIQVSYCGICGTDLHIYHPDRRRGLVGTLKAPSRGWPRTVYNTANPSPHQSADGGCYV